MNIYRIALKVFFATIVFSIVAMAQAQPVDSAKMLLYINPTEYINSVRLTHENYYDYWFNQGPPVEQAATQVLGSQFHDVGMCQGTTTGKILVWLKPDMFYNPLMRIFYGRVTANVYSGSGKYLGSYVGRAEKIGSLDIYPMQSIDAVYKLAMQKVAAKMQADHALQGVLDESASANEPATPCGLVTILQGPKPTPIADYFY